MFRLVLFFSFLGASFGSFGQQLIINEVSQGTGSSEYVEFVVIGSPTCTSPVPSLDLRRVIIDDNNGYFATGTGTGIATGALRFADIAFWQNVPQGTYIVIYNEASPNMALPPNDLSLTDGNCRLIIPASSTLLESTTVSPTTTNSAYPPNASWAAGGSWNQVAMANGGDSFQVPTIPSTGIPFHSVSWGGNSTNTIIYFSGTAVGKVFSFTNNTSNNWNTQANWTSGNVGVNETPGAPNNAANDAWIATMNPQCSVNPGLTLTLTPTNETCVNACDGSITSLVSNGQAPYTYLWSNGATTPSISNLCPGSYTLEVTTATGCSVIQTSTIAPGQASPSLTLSQNNESCLNACDGSISSTVSNGQASDTYLWSNGATTANLTNVCPGPYTLVLTTANGCTVTQTATVAAAQASPTLTLTPINETCLNACDGSISSTVSNGQASDTYLWSNGATTANLTNVCPGPYTLVLTTANGCTVTQTATVAAAQASPTLTLTPLNETCANACDGSISSTVSNGQASDTYLWSNGATTANLTNVCPGPYTLVLTTANGCTVTQTATVAAGQANANASIQAAGPFTDIDVAQQISATNGGGTWTSTCGSCLSSTGVFNPQIAGVGTWQICYALGSGACTDQQCITVIVTSGCTPQIVTDNVSICPGDSLLIFGSYESNPGVYSQVFVDVNGCDSTQVYQLSNYTVNDYTETIQLCEFDSVLVFNQWIYTSQELTQIEQTVNGCSYVHSVIVVLENCIVEPEVIFIPNVITANNDNLNDTFKIIVQGGIVEEGYIINRWGNIIAEFSENQLTWDGTDQKSGLPVQDGVYTYIIYFKPANNVEKMYQGFVTVLR
jgi:gliding motility-associated-like protein